MTYTKVATAAAAGSSPEDDDDDDDCSSPPQRLVNRSRNHRHQAAPHRARHNNRSTSATTATGGARTNATIPDEGGFSTVAALRRLEEDIGEMLLEYEGAISRESLLTKAQHFFRHPSETPLAWFPILLTVGAAVALLIAGHIATGLLLAILLAVTIAVCGREHQLRRTELHRKVRQQLLAELRLGRRRCADWTDANYPNLCSPLSPCVTLQWTYRDGRLVNLPWALLVRDDLVVLRPGQVAPTACVAIAGDASAAATAAAAAGADSATPTAAVEFAAGETYGVAKPCDKTTAPPLKPMARAPLPDLVCRLSETPYLENLRVSMEKFAQRPTSVYNLQRYLLVTKYIQVWGAIAAVLLTCTAAVLRHHTFLWQTPSAVVAGHPSAWTEIFILGPVCAVLPILPLVFPLLWIGVNLWGIARLQTLLGMPSPVAQRQQHQQQLITKTAVREMMDKLSASDAATTMEGSPLADYKGGDATDDGDPENAAAPHQTRSDGIAMGAIASAAIIVPDDDDHDPIQSTESNTTTSAAGAVTVNLDTPTGDDWTDRNAPLRRRTVFRAWLRLWRGDSRLLGRSANVVQVLGSITALCCVDKKGILSWPNPTAEKVFFLRDGDKEDEDRKRKTKAKAKQPERAASAAGEEVDEDAVNSRRRAESEPMQITPTTADDTTAPADAISGASAAAATAKASPAPPAVAPVAAAASQTSMDSDSSQPPLHHSQHKAANNNGGGGGAIAEVLDLTHDQHSAFRLAFDDHTWSTHLQSLKPLGLAILVNTCCPLTQAHYAQFCNHVTAVAMLDKDLVPVTNRYEIVESRLNSFMHGRCLCELAKQIGFTDKARDIFQLEGQIASYMHLQPDVVRRDIRFARQLHLASKVKVPFPHCLSVIMREVPSNSTQLLTQGTADIVLDCCDDYWDGRDLRPLTAQDRKRAQDFYQRSALTAYCTAFAYRPLRHGLSTEAGFRRTTYLELPQEMRCRMRNQQRTPSFTYDTAAVDTVAARLQQHSLSSDSLLLGTTDGSEYHFSHQRRAHRPPHQQRQKQRSRRTAVATSAAAAASNGAGDAPEHIDVDACFEMQCHQVFIGMVTMQYQAQTDIVQLIERLDQACVRFVHFSKENELRSRVFSEKMGLESGWNCHISLLSSGSSGGGASMTNSAAAATQRNGSVSAGGGGVNGGDSTLPTPKHSRNAGSDFAGGASIGDIIGGGELSRLLSVPPGDQQRSASTASAPAGMVAALTQLAVADDSITSLTTEDNTTTNTTATDHSFEMPQISGPADMENCRSLSSLTVSTEQSAPINFDLSNRAKLPRGIENIQPHLENVDNVPLLVSLFTDCSAEATREMLGIMQRHGEIVVCMGSSASNANAEIFLQADCAIAVEPLYPQVCQDIAAYAEDNLLGNRRRRRRRASMAEDVAGRADGERQRKQSTHDVGRTAESVCIVVEEIETEGDTDADDDDDDADELAACLDASSATISPIYLSRMLNAVACSISICREDSLSIVALIELSRRFSNGLWSCIQFWASCACSLALLNTLCACVALPPVLTPAALLYVMGVAVPALAVTLVRTDGGEQVMNRATSKRHTEFDSGVFGFVMFCYGCKFVPSTVIMLLSYCTFVSHPLVVLDTRTVYENFAVNVDCARSYILLAVIVHYVCISTSFVHRDFSIWRRNPATNSEWLRVAVALIVVQTLVFVGDMLRLPEIWNSAAKVWPIVGLLFVSVLVVFAITEMCKWEELKVNARAQRRARLDFGTKLGMNSPF